MNRRHAQVVDTIEEKCGRASENAQVDVTPTKQDAPDLMAIIKRYCGGDILDNAGDWRYLSDVLEELIAQRVAEERWACARVVEEFPYWLGEVGRREIGSAIRFRSSEVK